jgi:TorA maturation chaperone TorD
MPELLPYIEALPALAGRLPPRPDPDELAAAHYRLFGLNVFPYESVFLDPSGLLGGRVSAQVAARYDADGYRPAADVAPDHVGHQLGLLAHLAAAEADAWEDGRAQIAQEMQQRQQSFLAGHLARWLPPLLAALEAQDDAFYRATAALTWELAGDHTREEPASWSLPPRRGSPDLGTGG